MKNSVLKIPSTDRQIGSEILQLRPDLLESLDWTLLYLYGTYRNDSGLRIEEKANDSEFGIKVTLRELREILESTEDLYDLLIVGQKDRRAVIRKSDSDYEVFNSSDVVIEYFDCSYWSVASSNDSFLKEVKALATNRSIDSEFKSKRHVLKICLCICFVGAIYGAAKHLGDWANGVQHSFGGYTYLYAKAIFVTFFAVAIIVSPFYIMYLILKERRRHSSDNKK